MCCSRPAGCSPPSSLSLPPNVARAFACRRKRWRFALCAFGVLLRPNALIAAPILAAYIAWPTQISWKRTAILFVPAMAGFFALVQVVYYGALGATRQHPLQSIMVFDLGGISHFTKQNQFPVTWSEPESRAAPERLLPADPVGHLLAARALRFRDAQGRAGGKAVRHACRSPKPGRVRSCAIRWPISGIARRSCGISSAATTSPCGSPTSSTRRDRVSGSAGLRRAGLRCTTGSSRRRCFGPVRGCWFASSCAGSPGGDARRPKGAFALGVCGSAALYVLTFFAVGVASDFRYGYWAVLAGIAGWRRRGAQAGRSLSAP